MTLLDCTGTDETTARRFPSVEDITAASRFEAALGRSVTGREPGFWDLELELNEVSNDRIGRWAAWAADTRARYGGRVDPPIPAGRTTDRNVKPGHWLGLPLRGGGFGAALVVARRSGIVIFGDAFLYCFPRVFDFYPKLSDVSGLRPEHACYVAGTSLVNVRDGRWRVLGAEPGFRESDWELPPSWEHNAEEYAAGEGHVERRAGGTARLPASIVSLDPGSRELRNTNFPARSIESAVTFLAGRGPAGVPPWIEVERFTPARYAAWRTMNAEIRRLSGT
jgi:hypothetical protein